MESIVCVVFSASFVNMFLRLVPVVVGINSAFCIVESYSGDYFRIKGFFNNSIYMPPVDTRLFSLGSQ